MQRSGSATRVLFPSRSLSARRTGAVVDVTRRRAGWRWVDFAVRQIAPGAPWEGRTGPDECCLVLLRGTCEVRWRESRTARNSSRLNFPGRPGKFNREEFRAVLGPRPDVFAGYPHALYLPPHTRFQVHASEPAELADARTTARRRFAARVIRPEDCGFEIRGGGNATRQIVDIMPPDFPADRLMLCEVFTPAGNWSSYPPHKHDQDQPPGEVRLEEIYYYRFAHPDAYGFQRLYDAPNGRAAARDRTLTVGHGDVVLVRSGYHPFVTAHGYDAYYLNVLAGTRRSMAASDDPRYAGFRAWPPPDPRMPVLPPPSVEHR